MANIVTPYASWKAMKRIVDEVGATSLRDMRQVMIRYKENPVPGLDEWRARLEAEGILKGERAAVELPQDALDAFIAAHRRRAAVAAPSAEPTGDPLASRLLGHPALPADLPWPMAGGEPMAFLGQFNLVRAGCVPDAAAGTAMVLVFVPDLEEVEPWEAEVVALPALEGLALRQAPDGVDHLPPVELAFEPHDDLPGLDDPFVVLPAGLDAETLRRSNLLDALWATPRHYGTKVGGWPTTLQGPLNTRVPRSLVPPGHHPFVLQVDLGAADIEPSGTLFVSRVPKRSGKGVRHVWKVAYDGT